MELSTISWHRHPQGQQVVEETNGVPFQVTVYFLCILKKQGGVGVG